MASTTAKNGSAKTPTSAELANQIDVLKEDIAALTALIAEGGKDAANKKAAKVSEQIASAREKGEEAIESARAKADEAGHTARDFVVNQPATAIGIAAGVGFLLGYLGRSK